MNHRSTSKTLVIAFMHRIFDKKQILTVPNKSMVDVFRGMNITVEFDRPTPLQIDGEIIPNVIKYRAMVPDRTRKKGVCHG